MITTIFQCDRCKKEQNNSTQMWHVGVVCYSFGTQMSAATKSHIRLWCRECCDKFNLIGSPVVKEIPFPEITLEDKIREIIREELQDMK